MLYKLPLLILLLLMISAISAQSQINNDSNYIVIMQTFFGAPGDTAWLPISFKNHPIDTQIMVGGNPVTDEGDVGGFYIRFEYNITGAGNLLTPIIDWSELTNYVIDTFVTPWDTLSWDTGYNYKFEMVGRGKGAGLITTDLPPDTTYGHISCYHEPYNETSSTVMNIRMIPPSWDPINQEQPKILPAEDPSIVILVPFLVNATAENGDVTSLLPKNATLRPNQFASASGLLYILPLLQGAWFQVDTAGTNHIPEVNIIGGTTISGTVGTAISVTVTASDVDADSVCLEALNMPTGADFAPANPSCGDSSTAGTFTWTPTASQNNTTFYITFRADDGRAGVISDVLTITVGGTSGNNPPVIGSITPNSYTLEQGETLPTINVSATDPDGDSLWLDVSGMPGNATFVGSPSLYGRGSVNAIFNWMPSFADLGTYTITFRATDSAGLYSTQSIFVTVEVPDVDRLFSKSTYGTGTRPTGGIPGATPVIFPIDLISTRTVYGINFDMTYPASIVEIDSMVVTDRTPEYVVYDNIGMYPDSIRIVTFGLNNEPIDAGSSTAILNAYFSIDTAAVPGDYWVNFYDAWESVDPDPEIASLNLVVDSGIIQVDMLGDVNLDKHIDVADLVNVVGYIIGNYSFSKRHFEAANVTVDSDVNVVDLIAIINLIFGYSSGPSSAPMNYGEDYATLDIEYDDLEAGQMTKLNVRGEFPDDVAGVELQIDYDPEAIVFYDPEVSEASDKFTLNYYDNYRGRIKMVLYSNKPWDPETLIPAGIADILKLPVVAKEFIGANDNDKIRITRAFLSNSSAGDIPTEGQSALLPSTFSLYQNYPNPFNPVTKIEFEIGHPDQMSTQSVNLEIFNILGQRVKTLVNDDLPVGHHSVTWDATNEKGVSVATGIYLYRLEVGDKHQTKKMLLLK